eukprot:TRINITY_DN388_c0_g1_i1.p4 TRINITY_DN388_c0_g1~~TRINITY_DN388_c0_g1_i1.p4  ORF type:complete len:137 (+),score=51.51 TRINITY_DN388_c0_g1_i1:557-967(+)
MMDHVHLTCFPNDGLGMTILGLVDNIQRNIGVPMIKEYIRQHYTAKRMVMVGCGGVNHDHLTALAEKFWGDLPSYPHKPEVGAKFHDMLLAQVLQFYFGSWDRHMEDLNRSCAPPPPHARPPPAQHTKPKQTTAEA